jgi:hypothetical protein
VKQVAVEIWREQSSNELALEHALLLVGAPAERVEHRGRGDTRADPQTLQEMRFSTEPPVDLLHACVCADQISLEDSGETLPIADLREERAPYFLVREQGVTRTDQRKLLDVAVP